MTIFLATVALIYAASLCFVITLFTRTLLRERNASVDNAAGTILELSSAPAAEKSSPTDGHRAAKSA